MSYLEQHKAAIEERAGLSELLLSIPAEAAKREGVTEPNSRAPLNAEETEKFHKVDEDIRALDVEIPRLETLMKEEERANERQPLLTQEDRTVKPGDGEDYNSSLKRWALSEDTAEDRAALGVKRAKKGSAIDIVLPAMNAFEARAQSVGVDADGGYLRPEGYWAELVRSMVQYGGVMENARVIRTATGQKLPIPTVNDTSNTGEDIDENAEVGEQGVTFGEKELDAYKISSELVKASHEFINDSAFPVAGLIGSLLGERIGRRLNTHGTTGSGSSAPQGYVTGSTAVAVAAADDAVTHGELLRLKHGVDPSYRKSPMFKYSLNDNSLLALKQLIVGSADANPLWQPGMARDEPSTIDSTPYFINQDMADMAVNAKSFVAGDFSKFWLRIVENVRLVRLDERFAEFDQVGFVAFLRMDSVVVDTAAIKHLPMAAS